MQNTPLCRHQDLVVQELKDEVLIYDLKAHQAFCLNHTSALIWRECDGTQTISEISQKLSRETGQPVSEELIEIAVAQFQSRQLVDQSRVSPPNLLSRRNTIKKIALATTIALPVITALTAPSAIHAASTQPQACVQPGGPNPPGTILGTCTGNVVTCESFCNNNYAYLCQRCLIAPATTTTPGTYNCTCT